MDEYKWSKDAEQWLDHCEDTNEYCERNLIIGALIALEKDDTAEAKRRLLQVFSDESGLVDIPDHVLAAGESDEERN